MLWLPAYDAMDRAVEFEVGSAYTQIVYGPGGGKLALMSGQSLTKAFVPLAGGAVAVYNSSGLEYYRHGDWLGSSRLASTPSRGVYYDGAYAPYGENYAESGTKDRSFTGQDQDMVSSGSYPLYDFLMREYHPTWGRWISPDPAGLAAVDPTNPQTWNRYAYVGGNPLSFVDPLGLSGTEVGTCISGGDYCGFTITTTTTASACGEYYCANAYALMEQVMSSASDCATTHNCQQPGQNPGNSGGGGGGAGNPQNLPKLDLQALFDCTFSLYGVTGTSFVPSKTGKGGANVNGSFTGFGVDINGPLGPMNYAEITVTNNVKSYNLLQMQGAAPSGTNQFTIGYTSLNNPYVNYSPSDAVDPSVALYSQVVELGNSLALISGTVSPAQARAMDEALHPPGLDLENCTKKGE